MTVASFVFLVSMHEKQSLVYVLAAQHLGCSNCSALTMRLGHALHRLLMIADAIICVLSADKTNSRSLSSGPLEIEIEVPAELASPLPPPPANDSSEEEWETVGDEDSMDQPSPDDPGTAPKGPKNWRDRASHRQKYWSRMTGFQFGRKLGDWGKDEEPNAKPLKVSKRLGTIHIESPAQCSM